MIKSNSTAEENTSFQLYLSESSLFLKSVIHVLALLNNRKLKYLRVRIIYRNHYYCSAALRTFLKNIHFQSFMFETNIVRSKYYDDIYSFRTLRCCGQFERVILSKRVRFYSFLFRKLRAFIRSFETILDARAS